MWYDDTALGLFWLSLRRPSWKIPLWNKEKGLNNTFLIIFGYTQNMYDLFFDLAGANG